MVADANSEEMIVGSAEPLTPEQTQIRLQALKAWGVDLSLVQYNLELTPTQRIEEALQMQAFAEEMRRAMRQYQSGCDTGAGHGVAPVGTAREM